MNKHFTKSFLCTLSAIALTACQSILPSSDKTNTLAVDAINTSKTSQKRATNEAKISVDEVLSTLDISNDPLPEIQEDRFDVAVKNININSFLMGLVDSTDYNIIVSPEVDFQISLQLKNVVVSDVLHALTQIYPIIVKQKNNLFLVSSAETLTSVYPVNYLNIKRKGTTRTRVAGQSISANSGSNSQSNNNSNSSGNSGSQQNVTQIDSSNVETKSETDFWKELKTSLELIVKDEDKASVVVSPQAGIVVVRALPQTQKLIGRYLSNSQRNLDRQVIIEAKVIEVSLNDGFQSGVDWSKLNSVNGGDAITFTQQGQVIQQPTSESPINGIFSLLYEGSTFSSAINLLKSQGDVQVLSSPRVSTVNNQKAVIKVGSDEFFVTDVSTTTVTGTSTATTPNVTLTPFFSGISLDVTPQVSEAGDIILHIHPIVSEVDDQKKTLSLGQDQFTLPLALTNVRESDSVVRTRNGRVIVIGGLMQNKVQQSTTSTPLLGDVPVLGNLFKQTRQFQVKSELVILLQAHVVDPNQTNEQLDQIGNRFEKF